MTKIFCIGFNKTGTSSLHRYFQHHQLNSLHNLIWQEATHYLGPKRLKTFLDRHDAFSDGEMAHIERLYEMYPDAYFILNTRDEKSWLRSRVKWLYRDYPKLANGPMAQDFKKAKVNTIPNWILRRKLYHEHVISFCQENRINLLLLDVCSDVQWIKKLDKLLGFSTETTLNFQKNVQAISLMSEDKKAFLESKFQEIESHLNSEKEPISLPRNENIYSLRLDLSHLVKRRFNKS